MKAYLETVVVTNSSIQAIINTSVSQVVLEFRNSEEWAKFNDNFDAHEKGPGFEIFRTLLPLW